MKNKAVSLNEKLKDKGYRPTPQREAILKVLSSHKGSHLSCDEIFKLVKKQNPGIGLSTIYRTLPLLEKMELLDKILINDGIVRYEFNNRNEKHFHHHMICVTCGSISEIEHNMLIDFEKQLYKDNNFKVKNHSVKVYGYCKECYTD
jgi:Fur family ferric uptake transcriptional regulator